MIDDDADPLDVSVALRLALMLERVEYQSEESEQASGLSVPALAPQTSRSAANPNVSGRRPSPAGAYAVAPPVAVPEVSTASADEMAAPMIGVTAAVIGVTATMTSAVSPTMTTAMSAAVTAPRLR